MYVLLNTILTYILIAGGTTDNIRVINFAGEKLNFSLKLDGLRPTSHRSIIYMTD